MGITIDKKRKPKKPYCLAVVASLLISAPVFAQTVAQDLTGLGMPAEQADYLAGILPAGSTLGNNTYLKGRNQANSANIDMLKVDATDDLLLNSDAGDTIKFRSQGDDNRLLTYSSSSDAALALTFGDGGTTAAQVLGIAASTSDADDDSAITLSGGGSSTDARGAIIALYGNEVTSNGGKVVLQAGNDSDADMEFYIENASSQFTFQDVSSGELFRIANSGAITASKAADFNFGVGLATIAFQEAVAGTACSGTLTLNGASDVVTSTTCATTGSRIFLTRTSLDTDTTGDFYVKSISNGVSFTVAAEVNDTATLNWVIFHEAP